MERTRIPLDRLTWERWRKAVARSRAHRTQAGGEGVFAALLVLLLAINGLNVVNSYVGRDFMTAIEQRACRRFVGDGRCSISACSRSPRVAAVVYRFTEERLGLLWREWLTRRLSAVPAATARYYWLREQADIANPDQRIADDVRAFTATTLSLTLVLLNATFTIVAFSGVHVVDQPAAVRRRRGLRGARVGAHGRCSDVRWSGSTTTRPTARRACGRT